MSSTRKINEADKGNILVKLENFLQDITLNVIDVKDCVGRFNYENEWDAFIIANCERKHNFNCVEPQLEIENSSRSNLLSDESSDNEEDNELALERYKHFFNSWVEQIFDKVKQSRNYHELNCSYRLRSSHLGRGQNAIKLSSDETYAVEYNFNDIKLDVIRNFLVQEFTNGKYAEKFNQIYRQQKLISVTLDNVMNVEFIEEFVKSKYNLTNEEYNVKLFKSCKGIWHNYWLIKVCF